MTSRAMDPETPILLILDLDETLIHATEEPLGHEHDFLVGQPPIRSASGSAR